MVQTRALAKENVLIQAGTCAVTILPHLGGKIASIRVGETELLQSPLAPYGPRTRTMDFDAGDASGWDECLPSVAACAVKTSVGTARIPDHGDLWRVEWQESLQRAGDSDQMGVGEGPVTLRGECFSLPLALERTVTLAESDSGWELSLDYRVCNTGSFSAPWSWVAHPLFAVEEGDRIVLPDSIKTLRLEGSGKNRLGLGGESVSWPIATLEDGGRINLSVADAADSEIGDKLFAGPLKKTENWCALERPGAGVRIRAVFDPATTQYLGLWLCYGGWPERPGPKQNCVALEPATAPVDSLAKMGEWSRVLAPGECSQWHMKVYIETI